MKRIFLLVFVFGLLVSCSQNAVKDRAESPLAKLKKEAVVIAKDYTMKQLKVSTTTVDGTGIITVQDDQKRYIIDPSKIFIGLIDSDMKEDAIVPMTSYFKQDMGLAENLILLDVNGRLTLTKALDTDIKVVKLKDGIITAELHTKPRTSPLYNCSHCIEIVNYQFKDGELMKMK